MGNNIVTLLGMDIHEEIFELNFDMPSSIHVNDPLSGDEFMEALDKEDNCYNSEGLDFNRIDKLNSIGLDIFASVSDTDLWVSGLK
jgi:hypothetical protein